MTQQRLDQLRTATPDHFDRYINVSRRLWKRFSRGTAGVIVDIGGKPAPFKILETMAWEKYIVNHQ